MIDNISRQAVLELISQLPPEEFAATMFLGLGVEQLPSADTRIPCRECKYYEADIFGNPFGTCCHPGWVGGHIGHDVSADGWCYRAETDKGGDE